MYNTIWKYLKYSVLAVGFATLAIIFYIVIIMVISNLGSGNKQEITAPTEIYNKDFGKLQLKILREEVGNGEWLINISLDHQPLITNYKLQTDDQDWYSLNVTDAKIFPLANQEYGLTIFSTVEECDHCGTGKQIWLLKLNNKLNLVTMIPLFDLHQTAGRSNHYFANKAISTPYMPNSPGEQILIPLTITVGKTLSMNPILDARSADMLKQHFASTMSDRLKEAAQDNEESAEFLEKYKTAEMKFNAALSPVSISF